VDADFLVFYRIDLRDPNTRISAESFFARLFRLFHYRGALRDRLQVEQQEAEDHGHPPPAPTQAQTPSRVDTNGTRWVSPDEVRNLFPDLFSTP
jgi:hypothetical protein